MVVKWYTGNTNRFLSLNIMKSGFPLSIFKNFKCSLYIFLKRPYLRQQNTVIHWVKTNWTKYHLNRIANKIFRQEELNKNHLFLAYIRIKYI